MLLGGKTTTSKSNLAKGFTLDNLMLSPDYAALTVFGNTGQLAMVRQGWASPVSILIALINDL